MFDTGLRLAKVVRAHPDGHSVDLVMFDDNSPVAGVQTMFGGMASSRSGSFGMVDPTAPPDGEWGNQDSGDEDVIAVVGYMRGQPIVMGFMRQQVNQLSFGDKNRMGYRFPSDVYVACDKDGNFELSHPGGAFIRIATDPAHESLTGKDADKKWKRDRNTSAQCHIHIEQAGGKASVDIAPNGDTVVKSATKVTVDAPDTFVKGNLTVDGLLTYKAGLVGSGGGASITGDLAVDGNVTATGSIIDAGGNTNHHGH